MGDHGGRAFPADVLQSLQLFDNPMFIVTVGAGQDLRFGGLNHAHERATGMSSGDVTGKTPHEALPPRVADTVLINYRACLSADTATTYEELLDLPAGARWWRTTLTPYRVEGRVLAIIGSSVDITPVKERSAVLATDGDGMHRQVAALQTLAFAATSRMRGPLNNMVTLGRLLRAELRPPLRRKEQLLSMIIDTAVHALDEIDIFERDQELAQVCAAFGDSTIDFGHLCRDLAALIDPERRLNICFPDAHVIGPPARVEPAMQAALCYAAARADGRIDINLRPDAREADGVHLRLIWDARPAPMHDALTETRLRTRIDALGLHVLLTQNAKREGRTVLDLTLPSTRFVSEPAMALSQSGHASG
ncbi:MAG: PAS domain-containing protein [Pseudomonadota bacterium]